MVKLINGYGITETTIYSSFKVVTEEDIRARTASIGTPVSGTYVYILGPERELCPIGVIGELYIGGLGVGRGYLGRDELTRARFVDDPLRPGNTLYRSGDLARWLPSGEVEYLGRADSQVKVRGYRVELAEIEAALTAHAAIRESVVVVEAKAGTTTLIGFFTSAVQEDLAAVRARLEQQLPDYMVPSRLVQVERIPVTPNGKVDRAELLNARVAVPPPAPRVATPVEQIVMATWADVLGITADELTIDDSFFAVGGDSIGANLVVRMLVSRGLPVELLDLFEHPTLGGLAQVISARASAVDEVAAYWEEIAAAEVPGRLLAGDHAGDDRLDRAGVTLPLGELHARAGAEADLGLREVLLTSLGVALRMACGAGSRIGWVETPAGEPTATVAPLVLAITDINLARENLATVRDRLRRAASYRRAAQDVMAGPAAPPALAGGIVVHYVEHTGDSPPPYLPLIPGCLHIECSVSRHATVSFAAPAGALGADRLAMLAEAFKFAFRETLHALPSAPAQLRPAQVSLDVEPFNDVFFRDCTHQAVVAAAGYFGRDVHALLANTTAVCERDLGRSRGLRARTRYLDRRELDEVLAEAGLAVHRATRCTDIVEELQDCLAQGALGIVKVDCYFVERQRELFQTKHGEHTVLVCGYDQSRQRFDIIDNEAARAVVYRRATIGFDELRAAYDGYQRTFNLRGTEVSYCTVSEAVGRPARARDRERARREVRETLRLAHAHRDEERAALAQLYEDFCATSANEPQLMDHVEQLSFTFGELVSARRLAAYQLAHILEHEQLSQLVEEFVDHLETIHGLLTKLRVSRVYSAARAHSMQRKLDEALQVDAAYARALGELLAEP